MQPDTATPRRRGRPCKPKPAPAARLDRMVDALTIYRVDLSHTPAVHLALFRAGFCYSQVRDKIGEAIAVAQARTGRRL